MSSVPRCAALLLALPLAACRAPGPAADAAAARAACDLAPGEVIAADRLPDGRLARPLSQACAAHLAKDLGLDWSSFGRGPAAVDLLADPTDGLVAGAFLLVAAGHGPLAGLGADPLIDPTLAAMLQDEADRVGIDADEDLGSLLYAWVTARVDRVARAPALSHYAAEYEAGTRTVWVPDTRAGIDRPPWMASVLVHEASHLEFPGHEACEDRASEDCDEDLVGAYGLQAWSSSAYERGLADPDQGLGCVDAHASLATACAMINDPAATDLCGAPPPCGGG